MTEKEKEAIEIVKNIPYKHKEIFMSEDLAIAQVLNLIQRQQEENIKLKQENEKKDKIIDLMAETLKGVKAGSKYCSAFKIPPCKKDKTYPCDRCIKKYFEKEVENENI